MYGFVKVATANIETKIGNVFENQKQILDCISKTDADILVFPELCITGYTCGDMFTHKHFIEQAQEMVNRIVKYHSCEFTGIIIIGAPVLVDYKLYNCAILIKQHTVIGIVPKSYIPNYNEFYEARYFTPAPDNIEYIYFNNQKVPFGRNLLFEWNDVKLGVEICEDLWVPNAPSNEHCLHGANVIANLSASNEIIGKQRYRRDLVKLQSARCNCAYLYSSAGFGESTSDVVWSGHQLIAECGKLKAESLLSIEPKITTAIIDIEKIDNNKIRQNSTRVTDTKYETISVSGAKVSSRFPLEINTTPFVPHSDKDRKQRCDEILRLQATGLATRLKKTGIQKVVLGISGGLDSTLALLVCLEAFEMLGLDKKGIIGVTMPCFGTSTRTLSQAVELMGLTRITQRTVKIAKSVEQHLQDIQHNGEFDITYENAQARERTQVLMDIANQENALVIGTGDLSELALGWCTYNGDHMSMYAVNCSVPKTLVQYMVKTYAEEHDKLNGVLMRIYETKISPELLPPSETGEIQQSTEDKIGKYEILDFCLYHFIRNGFSQEKIRHMANNAFNKDVSETVNNFFKRFYANQFKRNCVPDGVKIGTVSLSPRGDWRFPSEFLV